MKPGMNIRHSLDGGGTMQPNPRIRTPGTVMISECRSLKDRPKVAYAAITQMTKHATTNI